jgi:hypothetical protein
MFIADYTLHTRLQFAFLSAQIKRAEKLEISMLNEYQCLCDAMCLLRECKFRTSETD